MKLHVLALGGSIIVPDQVDYIFLKELKKFIIERIDKNERFVIVTGGGKICRKYQQAASHCADLDDHEKDWLGIHATRLNAHLLKSIFKPWAHYKVLKDFDNELKDLEFDEKILICAGWKPGFSTDYVATIMAEKLQADTIINLSNIEGVYTEDPKKELNAKKVKKMSWENYRKICGEDWTPGLNAPFDPIATKKAKENNMTAIVLNGKNLENLRDCLDGKEFEGTTLQ